MPRRIVTRQAEFLLFSFPLLIILIPLLLLLLLLLLLFPFILTFFSHRLFASTPILYIRRNALRTNERVLEFFFPREGSARRVRTSRKLCETSLQFHPILRFYFTRHDR